MVTSLRGNLLIDPRGPYVPVRSDFAESETLVESDGVGDVEVDVAAAMASIELSSKTGLN